MFHHYQREKRAMTMTTEENRVAIQWPDLGAAATETAQVAERVRALCEELRPVAEEAFAAWGRADEAASAASAAVLGQLPDARQSTKVEGSLLDAFEEVTRSQELFAALADIGGLFDIDGYASDAAARRKAGTSAV